MKKFLSFLLCAVLLFSLSACGKAPAEGGAQTGAESGAAGTDAQSSAGTEEQKEAQAAGYDPDMEHLVILGMSGDESLIQVLDLNKLGEISNLQTLADAVIWEWNPLTASDCKYPTLAGAAGMKFRHSSLWDKDVVLLTNSNGWVGVIDYETKEMLFEDDLPKGGHCIEMMPNGDLVVASSGNGEEDLAGLYYYPLSQGATKHSDFTLFKGAHGVCYDPDLDCLWALGDDEIRMYSVSGYGTAKAKCQWVQGEGASLESLGDSGGHNLAPVYGQPGKYWVTSLKGMWQFDTATGKLSKSYKNYTSLSYENIKGIAYFADETAVQSGYVGEGGDPEYCSTALRIITLEESGGKVSRLVPKTVEIPFADGYQIYKVQAFNADYQ